MLGGKIKSREELKVNHEHKKINSVEIKLFTNRGQENHTETSINNIEQ